MRWFTFIFAAVFCVAMDDSLMRVLSIGPTLQVQPRLTMALIVFIALLAPRSHALWACWILGLIMDLTWDIQVEGSTRVQQNIIGPHAIAAVTCCLAVLTVRTSVFRQRALTIGLVAFGGMALTHLIVVIIFGIRSWYPTDVVWSTLPFGQELARRFLIAAYTGALAIPVGWLLVRSAPLWRFPQGTRRY